MIRLAARRIWWIIIWLCLHYSCLTQSTAYLCINTGSILWLVYEIGMNRIIILWLHVQNILSIVSYLKSLAVWSHAKITFHGHWDLDYSATTYEFIVRAGWSIVCNSYSFFGNKCFLIFTIYWHKYLGIFLKTWEKTFVIILIKMLEILRWNRSEWHFSVLKIFNAVFLNINACCLFPMNTHWCSQCQVFCNNEIKIHSAEKCKPDGQDMYQFF